MAKNKDKKKGKKMEGYNVELAGPLAPEVGPEKDKAKKNKQ